MKKLLLVLVITVFMVSLCNAEWRNNFMGPGDDSEVMLIDPAVPLLFDVEVTGCVNAENAVDMAGFSKIMHQGVDYLEIGWVWGPDNVLDTELIPFVVMNEGSWKNAILDGAAPQGTIVFKLDW